MAGSRSAGEFAALGSLCRRFLGSYRRYLIIGPACKVVEVIFDLLVPLIIAWMIDQGIRQGDMDVILQGGAALIIFAVVGLLFTLVCQKMASITSQASGTDIRQALFNHVNDLSYAELDALGTPSLITRITNDVNQVQVAVALGIRQLIRWPILAIGSVIAALILDWRLGLIFCVSMPLIAWIFWAVMGRCIPYYSAMQAKLDRIALIVRENLAGVRPVRAFRRERHEERRFKAAAEDQAATATAAGRLSSLLNPATFLVMNVAICAILWQGGIAVEGGTLEQGEVMAFIGYMNQLLLSIVYVANLVVVFTRAGASAKRIMDVLQTEPTVVPPEKPQAPEAADPILSLDHVYFSYGRSGRYALSDISLDLHRGHSLGVVGGTGSGKSTLASVILRFFDVSKGSVIFDGRDVADISTDELRHRMSVVPQKAALLSGTIGSNLRWRDGDADEEALGHALAVAQAAEFVDRLPEGLDYPVEAGGRNFSGGQRQRLTIARALVGNPELVILDDSASALDYATDAKLRRALSRDMDGLSRIIISQRVAAVRTCDAILVLDGGRVAGLGTHDELVRDCPLYLEICRTQLKEEEIFS